jgi:hypothetical protein
MTKGDVSRAITPILDRYRQSFAAKIYNDENEEHDIVMDLFGLTPILKRENRQYWGRELGMCWQLIVSALCRLQCPDYRPAQRFAADEPFDLIVGNYAIDTKYRIGSGDSGTLKKFKQYGPLLRDHGYIPVLLTVRRDNLAAAITACQTGGWLVCRAEETFQFIQEMTKFDLYSFLSEMRGRFPVERK